MSNCLFFALRRFAQRGGYIITRKSHHGCWPHFIWSADLKTFEEFVPLDKTPHTLFPPLLFAGTVRISDASEQV